MTNNAFSCSKMALSRAIALLLFALLFSSNANADGQRAEVHTTARLRVCADPANLPFSHKDRSGFENKIAELIADHLQLKMQYIWFPQSMGFVRKTLKSRRCDLIIGMSATSDRVQNTNPYYWSTYVLIYRQDMVNPPSSLNDPRLKELKIGVVAGTPPSTYLARQGLLNNMKPYQLMVDTRHDFAVKNAVDDVAKQITDLAVLWGPASGYFAHQSQTPLQVVSLYKPDDKKSSNHERIAFRISMAVRHGEKQWKRKINKALKTLAPQIESILDQYHVPQLVGRGEVKK